MASLQLNQLRASSTMKTTSEAIPRQSAKVSLGNGSHRHGAPLQSMTDFRTGENLNHLKLTAEKMMQEQAGVKSDLQILKAQLEKSEDQVRTLESKVQEMNNENGILKVKHKQDMKLWQGLDSKFLSTTTFCDHLAETLKLLDCQVQEAEKRKDDLECKLAEKLEFFEHTEHRLNDLLQNKFVADNSVKELEARNEQLHSMIREMEHTVQSDSIKLKALAVEKDDLQHKLTEAQRINNNSEAILRSNRCEIQDLQKEAICKAKEATDLQHQILSLRQANGELELGVKGLQSNLATTRKDNETLQQNVEMFKLKITDLEIVNASAAANIENLVVEKAKFMQQIKQDKNAQGKVVHELKQYLIEQQLDVEVMRRQLQESMKKNEKLVDDIEKKESEFASLQDENKKLSEGCATKNELISCMSQNEEKLRRETAMTQEQLTTAENAVKTAEIQFKLQLESQQIESAKRLEDVAERYNQEIDKILKKSGNEIEEAIATERLKGQDALKAAEKASNEDMAKALEAIEERWQSLQHDCERRITNLKEGHEKEKLKMLSIHADENHKQREELHTANETIKSLREGLDEKSKIISIHSAEVHKMQEELQNAKETIRIHREGHEQEANRSFSIHANEIEEKEMELQTIKKTISELREGFEQEKAKITAFHAKEIHTVQEQLRAEKETCNSNIAESCRKVEDIRKLNHEKMEKVHAELQKMTEEKSRLHETMKVMQLTHEEILLKRLQEQEAQFETLKKDRQAQLENVQNLLTQDVNEWRSKALGWEIQLKEAHKQITARTGSKEDKHTEIAVEDFKMIVTDQVIPTPVVTPMTKDKLSQKQNQRLTVENIVDLVDTTDEDVGEESQKPTPEQSKRHVQQSPRSWKRKMDVMGPSEEAPRMHGRTSGKKSTLDIYDKQAIHQHRAPIESTKPMEGCFPGNRKASLLSKENAHQPQLIKRQHPVDESRNKTGLACSQQLDLHPLPGPSHQKETRPEDLDLTSEHKKTAPKRRVRKSTKHISQERMESIKAPSRAPSPAISDLFEIEGLGPYYKGEDPYAFD